VDIVPNREALSRYGLQLDALSQAIETAVGETLAIFAMSLIVGLRFCIALPFQRF
jgi:Cu/Ag efflux pump CusA